MKRMLVTAAMLAVLVSAAAAKEEMKKMNVAIFVYEGVEILDFGGPSEVFASARLGDTHENMTRPFNVYTVAVTAAPVMSQGFITIVPAHTLDNCPQPDIIVLPGGNTGPSVENPRVIAWVQAAAKDDAVLMSVCTGAFILARAGLLDGKEATTWYGAIDGLKEAAPKTKVHTGTRFVDNGSIVTTAGVSAGIDGALHVVARLCGIEAARGVAKYMEYDRWQENAGLVVQR
ncbi:MAG TPA: DJ-1/PfpI family protein [Candidatus Krumholzibacteria bacterium]|nr:DJ-1/PfpI family protein [Candidatus Krumholzibacteria bacterium]